MLSDGGPWAVAVAHKRIETVIAKGGNSLHIVDLSFQFSLAVNSIFYSKHITNYCSQQPIAAVSEPPSFKARSDANVAINTIPTARRLKGPNPFDIRANTPISAIAPNAEIIQTS